jgi:hypothetical protein
MGGKYIRGALVEFMPTFLGSAPNVIVFQFNPETMTHAWTQPEAAPPAGGDVKSNPLAVKGMPGESFTFTLALDANEMIADGIPISKGLAISSGVYSRLAALEMLQYPTGGTDLGSLVGTVSAGIGGAAGGGAGAAVGGAIGGAIGGALSGAAGVKRPVPSSQVPTVIFVWGPGRIVPVRLISLSITERLYDTLLNPTHADVNITLRVLTPDELEFVTGPLSGIANAAYQYSQALRQALALANLGNSFEDVIGMLPL